MPSYLSSIEHMLMLMYSLFDCYCYYVYNNNNNNNNNKSSYFAPLIVTNLLEKVKVKSTQFERLQGSRTAADLRQSLCLD